MGYVCIFFILLYAMAPSESQPLYSVPTVVLTGRLKAGTTETGWQPFSNPFEVHLYRVHHRDKTTF